MYNHKEIEERMARVWAENGIYEKAKAKVASSTEKFYFCDGPPYATGQIHPGTAWNKCIKDAVCRYHRMCGKDVRAQPGYDTHGLPIEVKVEQELGIKNKREIEKLGIKNFIKKCKDFATRYIGVMSDQFRRLGVWMDWDMPYITYKDDYIESSWQTLKMAWEQGLMHEGNYVLPYCYRCETTMANYELEYGEETDPSIFVKFKIKGKENEYLIIWTTTPWTLVANMAVMVHPAFMYVKAKVDDEVWYLAKGRLDYLMGMVDKSAVILEEIPGRKLKGLEYEHPFQDKIGKQAKREVVLSEEYVNLEEGSGLVHCAPGHGQEDFIIGKRYEIEAFSPVDESGRYTEEAGEDFVGKNVREANSWIIELLKGQGSLIFESRIKHRYPHCWRCKTPLIFLTTNQWFISISKVKDRMIEEISQIDWHPKFAGERFREFVGVAPDWCISRQRYWGIPLPIWKCSKCSKITAISSRKELPTAKELHRPYVDAIELDCECGGKARRIKDVLDVWFDSGNAVWASLSEEEKRKYGERSEIIIEGQDQIRGWFYSLLGSGIVRYGKSPYKRLLMHGFFVDEHGEKMSKSLGNFIPIEEIIDKYGADAFRMWGLSATIWEEIRFNWNELKIVYGDLNIIYNLVTFLERFYPNKKIADIGLQFSEEDKWLLSRLNTTIKQYRNAFDNYELNVAVKKLRDFITNDLSRFYMKLAKDRISHGEKKEEALFVIYSSLLNALVMLVPIAPFISEYSYQTFFRKFESEQSVSLFSMPSENAALVDSISERRMEVVKNIISVGLLARQQTKIKTRWPVKAVYIKTKSEGTSIAVLHFANIIRNMLNAKEVRIVEEVPAGEFESASFEDGVLYISKTLDQQLYEEGLINDIKRRIQNMRKVSKLVEKDRIKVFLSSDRELEAIIEKHKKNLLPLVSAVDISCDVVDGMEESEIDGRLVKIKIQKV